MASNDLEHIRALLIAQTAEPEPRAKPRGLFARRRAPEHYPERRQPLDLSDIGPQRAPAAPPAFSDPDQEMLLAHIFGPEPVETPSLAVETGSPLPPPAPRSGFGRRCDELVLDQPAMEPRRLLVFGTDGEVLGEMILSPGETAGAVIAGPAEAHPAPFFPEDFAEPDPLGEPQPLRPWIKALRGSGNARPPQPVAPQSVRPPSPGLGRDLLEALALSLTREHETLCDRVFAVVGEALFQPQDVGAGLIC